MISFEPLHKTLKERGLSITTFGRTINIDLSNINKGKTHSTIATVEKICNTLNCDVSDVISWTEDTQLFNAPLKIDYDRFQSVLVTHGYSFYSAALKLNKRPIFFSEKKRNNSIIRKNDLLQYCEVLEIDPKEISDEIQ